MQTPGKRDLLIDNARFILILMVVFGHSIEAIQPFSTAIQVLYRCIYVVHVPALAFLAGCTAKPEKMDLRGLWRLLVVFQILYVATLASPNFAYWAQPYWILWFLLSLLCWRMVLPYFLRLPGAAIVSVALALASGLVPQIGYDFGLSRTFVFFPFFIFGHIYGQNLLTWCGQRKAISSRLLALLGGLSCAMLGAYIFADHKWFYGSTSYRAMGQQDMLHALMLRMAHLLLSGSATVALLVMIGKCPALFAGRGERSISVYLLHGFWVLPFRYLFVPLAHFNVPLALAMAVLLSWRLVWLLTKDTPFHAVTYLYSHSLPQCWSAMRTVIRQKWLKPRTNHGMRK